MPRPPDGFPLDPREGLAGPFDAAIDRGWRALVAPDPIRAEGEFTAALSSRGASRRAAAIGLIEALVVRGRGADALEQCTGELSEGTPTAPLLTACGEASARAGRPVEAYTLYARAVELAPGRPALEGRAEALREAAVARLLDEGEALAAEANREEAAARVDRALSWAPSSGRTLARAADIVCAAGDREAALEYYRQALTIGGVDEAAQGRAGDLALEMGEDALAVSIFDGLAARDPAYDERAAEARLAFRIANWPEAERRAARARRLTRSGAALLAWWMFPEVRDAKVTSGVVAGDVLDRADSRIVLRSVSLGLLDVDSATHRARPDGSLSRVAAARFLLRLSAILRRPGAEPACLAAALASGKAGGGETIRMATRCGLLSESGGSIVGGPEFTRGLDRLRSLFPTGEAMHRD